MMAMKGDGIRIWTDTGTSGSSPIAWHYLISYCITKEAISITKQIRKHPRHIQN